MKTKGIIGLVILIFNFNIYATEQSMDVLIYNDSISYIFSADLYSDFRPIRGYPLEPFIWKTDNDSVQKKVIKEMLKSYRWCMRGYIAKWKIRNDSLFLTDISYYPTVTAYMESEPSNQFPLQRLFPERKVVNEVYADWFTGFLRTVPYQSTYHKFECDEFKGKRKSFFVKDGLIIGIKET